MRSGVTGAVLAVWMAAVSTSASAVDQPSVYQPVQFGRVIVALKAGDRWLEVKQGRFGCPFNLERRDADGATKS